MQTLSFTEFKKRYDVNFKAKEHEEDFIGRGGYGTVYKGRDLKIHISVAIKRSPIDKNLLDEVEKASKVPENTNIARYLDGLRVETESEDFDIAVLQYNPKGNLNQLLASEKLSEEQIDAILKGILDGLCFLHNGFKETNGKHIRIIHRDLKPQNILIDEYKGKFTPLLTDFGISKLVNEEDALSTGKVEMTSDVGTLVFKAPEQIKGQIAKNNLDLWAFGVMLFKILKGRLPFYSDASPSTDAFKMDVMKQITSADLEDVYGQVKDQPGKYQEIIKSCLVRDIKERVQTASELIDILEEIPLKIAQANELFQSQKFSDAQKQFVEILAIRPTNEIAKKGLSDCKAAIKKQEKDNENNAILNAKIEALLAEAQQLFDNQKWSNAIGKYEDVLDIDKQNVLAKQNMDICITEAFKKSIPEKNNLESLTDNAPQPSKVKLGEKDADNIKVVTSQPQAINQNFNLKIAVLLVVITIGVVIFRLRKDANNNDYSNNSIYADSTLVGSVVDTMSILRPKISGPFIDERDMQIYPLSEIRGKIWLMKNMNYNVEGSILGQSHTARLYSFNQAQKICPKGFHISSPDEWLDLLDYMTGGFRKDTILNINNYEIDLKNKIIDLNFSNDYFADSNETRDEYLVFKEIGFPGMDFFWTSKGIILSIYKQDNLKDFKIISYAPNGERETLSSKMSCRCVKN